MTSRRLIAVLFVFVLVLAACGGDGDSDTTQAPDDGGGAAPEATDPPDDGGGAAPEATDPPDDGGGATPEVTEMGSFTVNGTEFAVNLLNRCIPFEGPDSDQIDLQPLAQGQGAQLNLYGNADSLEVSVQGSAVEEIGGSIAFGADTFSDGSIDENNISGDRWTGAATLDDVMGEVDPVTVTWDVMIPEDMNDCSL